MTDVRVTYSSAQTLSDVASPSAKVTHASGLVLSDGNYGAEAKVTLASNLVLSDGNAGATANLTHSSLLVLIQDSATTTYLTNAHALVLVDYIEVVPVEYEACFTYSENDVLGFDVDYTSADLVIRIYLNGLLVDTVSFTISNTTFEIQPFAQFGAWDATDNSLEFRTYPAAMFFDVPEGAEPLEDPSGYTAWEYLSTGGYISHPDDTVPNRPYHDEVKSFPVFRRSVDTAFSGSTNQPFGDIIIHNENGSKDGWLTRSWGGRDLVLFVGDRTWPRDDFRRLMKGTSHELSAPDEATLNFRMRDKGIFLEKNVQEERFISGPSVDKLKPLCFGRCYHVPAVLIDNSHTYMVHDGEVQAITEVYDRGVALGLGVGYTVDLVNGTFQLNASPAGQITADVQGAKFIGVSDDGTSIVYHDTVANIIYEMLNTYSDLTAEDIDGFNLLEFDQSYSEPVGLFIDKQITFARVFDMLLRHLSGFWGFDRYGRFKLGRLISPTATLSSSSGTAINDIDTPINTIAVPVNEIGPSIAVNTSFVLKADDVKQRGVRVIGRQLPLFKAEIGYRKYWHTFSQGELAGTVLQDEDATVDLTNEYRSSINERPLTKLHHALATESGLIESLLVDQADAAYWALQRRDLFSQTRTTYSFETFAAPFGVDVGDVIEVEFPRYGFNNTVKALVTAYSESINPDRVDLELWR